MNRVEVESSEAKIERRDVQVVGRIRSSRHAMKLPIGRPPRLRQRAAALSSFERSSRRGWQVVVDGDRSVSWEEEVDKIQGNRSSFQRFKLDQ